MKLSNDLNDKVFGFGREIFSLIGKEQPGTFNKQFWSGRIMEWSMTKPDFKVNMFRLVDVLPNLRSSSSVARHVTEYLGASGKEMNALMSWGLNVDPDSVRAKLTSFAVRRGVKEMASQFIAGEGPHDALKPLHRLRRSKLAFTVDLLGEFTLSEKEAQVYLDRYLEALDVFGKQIPKWEESPIVADHPGDMSPICISVKLTALYSQCNQLNFERTVDVLSERLGVIAKKAMQIGASIYVDAEDSGSNPMVYAAFKRVFSSPELRGLAYPGIVVQGYAKESEQVVRDLLEFAKKRGAPIAMRLVKGAYWDYETITSKLNDWPSPLFKHKESTDCHYEHLSRILIDNHAHILPAFGSHNIRSLSYACCYAEEQGLEPKDFELQMLYGMAEPIAKAFTRKGYLVRLYVPLGDMFVGMGYLVRRLLENTSNESFLRHTFFDAGEDSQQKIASLLKEPRMRE